MQKDQLIFQAIRQFNTTAQPQFLEQFDTAALQQYLDHLQAAQRRDIRIACWTRRPTGKLRMVS